MNTPWRPQKIRNTPIGATAKTDKSTFCQLWQVVLKAHSHFNSPDFGHLSAGLASDRQSRIRPFIPLPKLPKGSCVSFGSGRDSCISKTPRTSVSFGRSLERRNRES